MSRGCGRTRGRMMGMRRWDGRSRLTTDWFGYHNDPELNFSDGDILVFLNEPGRSHRGPSFRVHTNRLTTAGFQSLANRTVTPPDSRHGPLPARSSGEPSVAVDELYLPAPQDAAKDAIARHHLATRNFFAWLYDRPLTGKTLGGSLVEVMNRAHMYRPNEKEINERDMLAYLQRMGYTDFRGCVDHALAVLHLAETFQMEALWVDAFAHCVGLDHNLHASIELNAISRVTKAMITRARLEMEVRLDRVGKSLTTFFDSDLSGSYLGLTQTAKDHMDRFRSFLHAHYIESHGFWPPSEFESSFALRQSIYRSMYVEFRDLYQHLVDPESKLFLQHNKPMEGGICTLQNVRAFDIRYRLETLPYPLPLLPVLSEPTAPIGFSIRKRRLQKDARHAALMESLIEASNREPDLLKSRLVRRYIQFEKQSILDDFDPVNPIEGRKVRWILIYAIFQILASVISAPAEVKDTEGLSYPLCCQRPKTMPWMIDTKEPAGRNTKDEDGVGSKVRGQRQELRPDVDYVTSQRNSSSPSLRRSSSTADTRSTSSSTGSSSTTAGLKPSPGPSLLHFLQKRGRSSTDAAEIPIPVSPARPNTAQYHEILVHGYGNGLNEVIDDTPRNDSNFLDISHQNISSAEQAIPSPTKEHTPSNSPYSQLPPINLNLPNQPDSPTIPTHPTTPSTSRESSPHSKTSRLTSNASHTSNSSIEEPVDCNSTNSMDTATIPPPPPTATATPPAHPVPTSNPPPDAPTQHRKISIVIPPHPRTTEQTPPSTSIPPARPVPTSNPPTQRKKISIITPPRPPRTSKQTPPRPSNPTTSTVAAARERKRHGTHPGPAAAAATASSFLASQQRRLEAYYRPRRGG